jgi:hypothetical protein
VRFSLGAGGGALMTDMPNYGESRPNERHRTENEDAKQNSHRGEDNKWWEEEGAGGAAGVTQSGKMAARRFAILDPFQRQPACSLTPR